MVCQTQNTYLFLLYTDCHFKHPKCNEGVVGIQVSQCVPVDGHHREAAAAATGERIWRYLLSRQSSQHTTFPPKEVCDQTHEFQQGDGVISAKI